MGIKQQRKERLMLAGMALQAMIAKTPSPPWPGDGATDEEKQAQQKAVSELKKSNVMNALHYADMMLGLAGEPDALIEYNYAMPPWVTKSMARWMRTDGLGKDEEVAGTKASE